MSLIRFQNVNKSFDGKPVLREAYFRLSAGDRLGLIGKNGSGKTTFLRLVLGEELPDEGSVEVNPGLRVGYFSQFSSLDGEITVERALETLFEEIHAIEYRLREIENAFAERPNPDRANLLLLKQAELLEEMELRDGWNTANKIDTALTRLGFNPARREIPIDQLSGGWRNRAALAHILLQQPDILLLDEPTNFLDLDGLAWLEDYLMAQRGALILVSHDRHFLEKVANRIIEIENYHLQDYPGGFLEYIRQKPLRLKSLERQFQYEAELLVYEADAIRDRQEARRNPTQALQRRLANIKKKIEPRPVDKVITDIYANMHASQDLCRVERLTKAYDDQELFTELSFEIHRGERFAVVGPNGCGKTTLLRALSQAERPGLEDRAYDSGEVHWAKGSAYVFYNEVFQNLDLQDTVSHSVNVVELAYLAQRKKVNAFLSLFQFSEMDLNQRIGALSGGQRARVALAQCLLSGANVILLDEPTNHLDMTSTQVMERALLHFPGAVVVVSHDRFFIDKIATHLLVFEGSGKVTYFTGNWTLYEAGNSKAVPRG
jgi:ATPase subunit of ABC transporter with duplicated ATPase domains